MYIFQIDWASPILSLFLSRSPTSACRSNECVGGSLCERQASEDDRSIDVEWWCFVLRAVQDWRRVTALRRASVQCVRLVVPRVERTTFRCGVGHLLHHSAWQRIQPVRARRAFKKVVIFLSIDCPHTCSPRPSPPPLICVCRRSWTVFVVWVAVEQSLTDGWGYTVRSQTMTWIKITSSIHATTSRQENDIQGATQEQCNYETIHGTTLQVLAVGLAKEEK
jgi:hypothetical protein